MITPAQFAKSVERDVERAGVTPAERLDFYTASVKAYGELTPAQVALLQRYEAVKDSAERAA